MTEASKILISGDNVSLSVMRDGLAIVTFDSRDNRVNLLSSAVMAELETIVAELEKSGAFSAVVFCSAKDNCFIAGADIKEILKAQAMPEEAAFKGCQDGKALLARIAALSITTVAAINGRCLGGGTELALVCDERLASDTKGTVIGLPEVGLGVLPGWGGTVRLPLMVGFLNAAPLILNPLKPWSARKAWRKGLVSEVVAPSDLLVRAIEVARGADAKHRKTSFLASFTRSLTDMVVGRALVSWTFAALIKAKLGNKYPAPFKALNVMNAAMSMPITKAFELESSAFAHLCHTMASAECVQKFMEYQRAKKMERESGDRRGTH